MQLKSIYYQTFGKNIGGSVCVKHVYFVLSVDHINIWCSNYAYTTYILGVIHTYNNEWTYSQAYQSSFISVHQTSKISVPDEKPFFFFHITFSTLKTEKKKRKESNKTFTTRTTTTTPHVLIHVEYVCRLFV